MLKCGKTWTISPCYMQKFCILFSNAVPLMPCMKLRIENVIQTDCISTLFADTNQYTIYNMSE